MFSIFRSCQGRIPSTFQELDELTLPSIIAYLIWKESMLTWCYDIIYLEKDLHCLFNVITHLSKDMIDTTSTTRKDIVFPRQKPF